MTSKGANFRGGEGGTEGEREGQSQRLRSLGMYERHGRRGAADGSAVVRAVVRTDGSAVCAQVTSYMTSARSSAIKWMCTATGGRGDTRVLL